MASDRALQKQRERFRYGFNGYESDQGFHTQDSGRSSEVAYSEQDHRLKLNKHQHIRALTISIPAASRNARQSLPVQWSTDVSEVYVNGKSPSPPASTLSVISSIPSSPPMSPKAPLTYQNSLTLPNDGYRQGVVKKQRSFGAEGFDRNELVRQRRHFRSVSRSRPVSNTETEVKRAGPSSSQSYLIRCSSAESYNKTRMSRSSALPPSESHSPSSDTEDSETSSIIELYKQMVGNHLELLEYASNHIGKFFRRHDLVMSKAGLQKLKLNDLIFESLAPAFSKHSTHFFDAFLPHDDFFSTAISLMAEPMPRQYSNFAKLSCSAGNIWNPPTFVEIKAQRDEERRMLRSCPRYQNNQKYRFLVIPRYNFLTVSSLASNHLNVEISEGYERQLCFIMLQLVCALKSLQLNGIEAVSSDISEFILLYRYPRTNFDAGSIDRLPRILLLQEALKSSNRKPTIGLCSYGLKALATMLNCDLLTNLTFPDRRSCSLALRECAKALQQDKSSSLTDAKNALNFGMFVGHDIQFKDEDDAQAWIDSQRAEYVNYLFREVIDGSCTLNEAYEQLRLQFLLSAIPRTLLKSCKTIRS